MLGLSLTLEASRVDQFEAALGQFPIVDLAVAIYESESVAVSVLAQDRTPDLGEVTLFGARELELDTFAR